MRQLGVIAVPSAIPTLTHGAESYGVFWFVRMLTHGGSVTTRSRDRLSARKCLPTISRRVRLMCMRLLTDLRSAVFSVIRGVVPRPLPYNNRDRLVALAACLRRSNGGHYE